MINKLVIDILNSIDIQAAQIFATNHFNFTTAEHSYDSVLEAANFVKSLFMSYPDASLNF